MFVYRMPESRYMYMYRINTRISYSCLLPELFLSVWQTTFSQNCNETPQIGISSSSGIQNFVNVARCYIHHLLVGEKYHSERNVA